MRNIYYLNRHAEGFSLDPWLDDDVSTALVNRLKARIARRESRLKTRVIDPCPEAQVDPPLMPAA
jgi:hypothetical protein